MHTRSRTWPLSSDPVQRCRDRTGLIDSPDGSTLTLDFTTGVLDPRLTFTRTSNATFINSSGLVEVAAANEFINSSLAGASGSTPPTGWSNAVAGASYSNPAAKQVTISTNAGGTARAYMFQTMSSGVSGLRHTIRFSVVSKTEPAYRLDELVGFPSNGSSGDTFTVNGTSRAGSYTAWGAGDVIVYSAVPTGGLNFFPSIGCGIFNALNSTTSVTITEPQLNVGGVPTAYLENTSISSRLWNTPRFDHDPTAIGTPRGLLIEASATNLFLNSSLDSSGTTTPANWSRGFSQCTVASVNSTVFPGMKAWSISATASGQRDWLTPTVAISVAANTTYTVSVYVESRTGTLGPSGLFAYFDAVPSGATSTGISNPVVGRNTCTLTVGATAGTATFRIGIGTSGGGGVTSDAQVTFSHLQIETGSGASSYIPTGASQGSRAADVCYADNISSWYTQGIGTMLFVGRPIQLVTRNYLGFSTGTNPPRLLLYGTNATEVVLYLENSTAANLIFPSGSTTLGSVNRMAASFEPAGYSCVLNGGTVGTSTTASPAMPTSGINRMNIGMRNDQFNQFYGHVVQVKYWPYRLPNAQLQSLTT